MTQDHKGKKGQFASVPNMWAYHCAEPDCDEFAIIDEDYETPDDPPDGRVAFYEEDGAWYCARCARNVPKAEKEVDS